MFLAAGVIGFASGTSEKAAGGMEAHAPFYDTQAPNINPAQSGAVVFTGGPGRVKEGIRMYMSGEVKFLLISGAGKRTSREKLVKESGIEVTRDINGIDLDHTGNTAQNADNVATWQRANNIKNIVAVTGIDHMERALLNLAMVADKDVKLFRRNIGESAGISTRMVEGVKTTLTRHNIRDLSSIGIIQTRY